MANGLPLGLGIASSIGTSLFNNFMNLHNADVSYRRQRDLMALQQQYAVENWNRETRYNHPVSVMNRLKEAGLNPNLIYGELSGNMSSPGISAPSSPGAPMASPMPMTNPIAEGAAAAQGIAMAKKAGSETIAQDIENEYLSKTLDERINSVALQNKWTEEQTNTTKQQYSYLVGQINVLQKDADIKAEDLKIKQAEAKWINERLEAEVNDIKQSWQFKKVQKDMAEKEKEMFEQTFDDLKDITHYNAQILDKTFQLLDKYGDFQAVASILAQLVDSATDIVTAYKKIFPSKK